MKNTITLGTFTAIVLGVMYGTMLDISRVPIVDAFVNDFLEVYIDYSVINIIGNIFYYNMIIIVACYLFGYSAVGQLVTYIFTVLCGLFCGGLVGNIYKIYLFKGVMFNLVCLMPSVTISIFTLTIAVRESVKMSNRLLCIVFRNRSSHIQRAMKNSSKYVDIKQYNIKFAILSGFMLISSILGGICSFIGKNLLI